MEINTELLQHFSRFFILLIQIQRKLLCKLFRLNRPMLWFKKKTKKQHERNELLFSFWHACNQARLEKKTGHYLNQHEVVITYMSLKITNELAKNVLAQMVGILKNLQRNEKNLLVNRKRKTNAVCIHLYESWECSWA